MKWEDNSDRAMSPETGTGEGSETREGVGGRHQGQGLQEKQGLKSLSEFSGIWAGKSESQTEL